MMMSSQSLSNPRGSSTAPSAVGARPVLVESVRSHGHGLAQLLRLALGVLPHRAHIPPFSRQGRNCRPIDRDAVTCMSPWHALRPINPRIRAVFHPHHPQVREGIGPVTEGGVPHPRRAEALAQHPHHGTAARVPHRGESRQGCAERVSRHDDVAERVSIAQLVEEGEHPTLQVGVQIGIEIRGEDRAVLPIGAGQVAQVALILGPIPLFLPGTEMPVSDRLGLISGGAPPRRYNLTSTVAVEHSALDSIVSALVPAHARVLLGLFLGLVRSHGERTGAMIGVLLNDLAGATHLVEEALDD
mmetsp:Transcript_31898/g.95501  ORF Transcript_31898/g.95501 Transcript_31898/m.95501 type:complete len:301 (-) Transcript_31898:2245-3147(-)